MVYFSRVRRDASFYDPFCGSGTLLIEAALYAQNIAPGIRRGFSSERWHFPGADVWKRERELARSAEKRDVAFQAFGSDIDPGAVALTLKNAEKAGVSDRIRAEKRDIADFREDGRYGYVICNPPYGERMLDLQSAQKIYRTMGKVFVPRHGWSYSVISPDGSFEQCFGRRATRRRKLYNGMIRCQYFMYFNEKPDSEKSGG